MSAAWIGVACLVLGLIVGRLSGRRRYDRGVDHGRRLTELAHGYVSTLEPGAHKRRRWSRVNLQRQPKPAEPQPLRPGLHY